MCKETYFRFPPSSSPYLSSPSSPCLDPDLGDSLTANGNGNVISTDADGNDGVSCSASYSDSYSYFGCGSCSDSDFCDVS